MLEDNALADAEKTMRCRSKSSEDEKIVYSTNTSDELLENRALLHRVLHE